jgi:hypothetical protein
MNKLVIAGILLMILGGGLGIKDHFTETERHTASILGAEISVTETETRPIPVAVSVGLFGVGAALAVIGALQEKNRSGSRAT